MKTLTPSIVVEKSPADFVGGALGQSEQTTKNILNASVGKVLIIDEAYGLDPGGRIGGSQPDPFKSSVIDTIVGQVQNNPGEDLCVLLLGYKEPMEEMLNNSNPGLARRFRLSDAFHFEDFNDVELSKILDYKLKKQGLEATEEARRVAIKVLAKERDRPNFGNAGAVENLLSHAKELEQRRRSSEPATAMDADILFIPEDFDAAYDRVTKSSSKFMELFAEMVGHQALIERLGNYQRVAANAIARGLDPRAQVPFNFIFKGPSGESIVL